MLKNFFAFRTLKKARRSLRSGLKLYRRKKSILSSGDQSQIELLLTNLQNAIVGKNAPAAHDFALALQENARRMMPKSRLDRTRDFILSLLFAAAVALVVRQVWFEPYTIPTGSMRPTLKEEDLLLVSKTDYGINKLTPTSHYSFDPSLLKRGSIVVFSGAGMDLSNNDTKYFWIIPGKKQYVKRLIGKPGDTLYFYGGKIYGIDADGNDLSELREGAFENLEHIPFLRLEGKPTLTGRGVIFHQVNEPIARLTAHASGSVTGVMNNSSIKDYFDLWGFNNFAMARLLTKEQMRMHYPLEVQESAPFYLEMTHHPSLHGAFLDHDEYGRLRPTLGTSVSFLPLDKSHAERMMKQLTTCRFVVKNGRATRFGASFKYPESLPLLKGVPDGMYEFQNGKAHRVIWTAYPPIISILWNGLTFELPKDHPLMRTEHLQTLYNLGIEFNTHYDPSTQISNKIRPSRYTYFRDGALYVMGSPLFEKGGPHLAKFMKLESQKTRPFTDRGAPDLETIRSFGLKVPDGHVFLLGDNHAMSADSRIFGFVPYENLRGGASFLYWPPSPRWGRLPQPSISHFTLPNCTVWGIFFLSLCGSSIYLRRKCRKPLKFSCD